MSRNLKYIVLAAALAVAATLYFVFDPANSVYAPKCTFKLLTGFDCPGCGSQRMVHALLHADFGAAWKANAMLLCLLPLLAAMTYAAFTRQRHPRLYAYLNSPLMIALLAVAIVAWTLFRNL